MNPANTIISSPSDRSVWEVIPNPDPSNIDIRSCECFKSWAVRHRDGGIIRFYLGRPMDKETAQKLKQELESEV